MVPGRRMPSQPDGRSPNALVGCVRLIPAARDAAPRGGGESPCRQRRNDHGRWLPRNYLSEVGAICRRKAGEGGIRCNLLGAWQRRRETSFTRSFGRRGRPTGGGASRTDESMIATEHGRSRTARAPPARFLREAGARTARRGRRQPPDRFRCGIGAGEGRCRVLPAGSDRPRTIAGRHRRNRVLLLRRPRPSRPVVAPGRPF